MFKGKQRKTRGGPLPSISRRTFTHPPPIHPQITQTIRLRFTATSNFNGAISFKNLLDCINVAATPVTAYSLYDEVKLLAVEAWSNPAIGAAPQNIFITYEGLVAGQAGDAKTYSDTSIGIEPAHVRCHPDRMSQAAQWQPASANAAFNLTVPTTSVIDVSVIYRVANNIAPVLTANAPVGAVAGNIYFRGLDGLAAAGTALPAVALLTD